MSFAGAGDGRTESMREGHRNQASLQYEREEGCGMGTKEFPPQPHFNAAFAGDFPPCGIVDEILKIVLLHFGEISL